MSDDQAHGRSSFGLELLLMTMKCRNPGAEIMTKAESPNE
jgi:hypothetical protein